MGELAKYLGQNSKTVEAIYAHHKRMGDSEPRRGYLGASSIGHECERFLWYQFRGACVPEFEGRLYRLFETGDLEEIRFVRELRAIGCEVLEVDPETEQQWEVHALGGHFSGHADGAAVGILEAPKTWHVLEFKTHAAKYFAQLLKVAVEAGFPKHYAQTQAYMGLMKLTRALYLARNKNTDDLYSERIRFDSKYFKTLMAKAERIIRSNKPLERCAGRSDDFRCKFCDAHAICWGDPAEAAVPIPFRNCETCCHATPELDGKWKDTDKALWTCARQTQKRGLTPNERQVGCDGHLLLPGLVWFADPVDSADDWIEFENHADKARWTHGYGERRWTTEELMRSPGAAVGDRGVEKIKEAFGGEARRTPLTHCYSPGDAERLWDGKPEDINDALAKLGLIDVQQNAANREEEDAATAAYEYVSPDGEQDICVVIYKADKWAAIWKGKM